MTWEAYKQSLHSQGYLPACFVESRISRRSTSEFESEQQSPYLPRHADLLLRDLGQMCDRMTTYLREMNELEVLAVRSATDRRVHVESREFERKLAEIQLGAQVSELRADAATAASKAFSGADPLSGGFANDALGRATVATAEVALAASQVDLLRQRWALADTVNDEYWKRHTAHGNAHNYEERFSWAKKLLSEEITTSFEKAAAIHRGLSALYRIDHAAPPEVNNVAYVQDLVLWTRAAYRLLEIQEQYEQEVDLTVPLVQPIFSPVSQFLSLQDFRSILTNASQNKVPAEFRIALPDLMNLGAGARIRAIGLTFTTESDIKLESGIDRTAQRLSYARLRATIELPNQGSRGDDTAITIYLGDVHAYSAMSSPAFVSGKRIHNCDFRGEWRIALHPLALHQGHELCNSFEDVASYVLTDLRLHLRLLVGGHP